MLQCPKLLGLEDTSDPDPGGGLGQDLEDDLDLIGQGQEDAVGLDQETEDEEVGYEVIPKVIGTLNHEVILHLVMGAEKKQTD